MCEIYIFQISLFLTTGGSCDEEYESVKQMFVKNFKTGNWINSESSILIFPLVSSLGHFKKKMEDKIKFEKLSSLMI